MLNLKTAGMLGVFLLPVVFVAACVIPTKFMTNKGDIHLLNFKKILVFSSVGITRGANVSIDADASFREAFNSQLIQDSKSCSVEVEISRESAKEKDFDIFMAKAENIDPDSLMIIRPIEVVLQRSSNNPSRTLYKVELIDVGTKKTVWVASAKVYFPGPIIPVYTAGWAKSRGTDFARELVAKLIEEQIYRSCTLEGK